MSITIAQLKVKVDNARNGVEQETAKIIKQFEDKILDYIRIDQLYNEGIDGNSQVIGTYKYDYSGEEIGGWGDNSKITSAGLPKRQDSPYNFVWSGYTISNLITDYGNFELIITNNGSSSNYLKSIYSEELFSLTEENKEKLRKEIIIPGLTSYLKGFFG